MKVTESNRKEMGSIISYLATGAGAENTNLKYRIVEKADYITSDLSEVGKNKVDAIMIISKDNHFLGMNFPEAPIYFVTTRNNLPNRNQPPEGLTGVLRVKTERCDDLIKEASNLLKEVVQERTGKNIAIYCDMPRLASQLLDTDHRLFIAEHEMPLSDDVHDYEYCMAAFACSVWASRKQVGRSVLNALFERPCLHDQPMKEMMKNFSKLVKLRELETMGFSKDFIEYIVDIRRKS